VGVFKLNGYISGTGAVMQTPITFFEQVYAIVERIPEGKVLAYGQIAHMLHKPRAAREVGWAMRYCPEHLPWQRVVMADGRVTGGLYAEERKARLTAEGVPFLPDGRVDMKACNAEGLFEYFDTNYTS
jgi:methylated-DNA-protein-cysteine methyltransferase-like protein